MFVAEDLTIGVSSRAAQARFGNLLRGTWLAKASDVAEGGVTGTLRVGPAAPVAAKLVRVSVLDPVFRGDVMSVGLRWEAAGPASTTLFPVLDANISIGPAGPGTARLALSGSYRPPLGRLGAGLDRAVMHRVATATARSFLHSVAAALTQPGPPAPAGEAGTGLGRVPESGLP